MTVKGKSVLKDKSLKQLKEETEKLTKDTGHYAGIRELTLKEQDPLLYELFHSRLLAAVVAARESCTLIAATPLVNEVAELLVSLYTPDGDCIVQSTGIQIHTKLMGRFIKWMIEHDYEEEVGIRPGDVFTCNDNAIAGVHPADVYDVMPVFCEDELVAWAATAIMEQDIGAVTPGMVPTACNFERYTDGLHICAEKTGEDYRLRTDVAIGYERKLRLTQLFVLNRKGAITADIQTERESNRIIGEFGLDYFKRASREIIEDERRGHLARVRERMVPGRYRVPVQQEILMADCPVPPFARQDVLRLTPLEMNLLPSGQGIIDLDGAGAWGWHAMNGTPQAMEGGLAIAVVQVLSYDGKANAGTLLNWEIKVPYDTIVNPSMIQHLPTACTWSPTLNIWGSWLSLLSRSFYARGFREEIMLAVPRFAVVTFGGFNKMGLAFGGANSAAAAPGSGARGVTDGIDTAFALFNTEADLGCTEVFEMMAPQLEIGKGISPDSGGFGKYRGGNDLAATYFFYECDFGVLEPVGMLNQFRVLPDSGIFGGYPGAMAYWYFVKDSNLAELVERGEPLSHREQDPRNPEIKVLLKGKFELVQRLGMWDIKDYDVVQIYHHTSNGGYGDPIERDAALIKADLDNGLTTPETCRNVYCAELSFDPVEVSWRVDPEKSEELRQQQRRERLGRAVPVEQWWREQRERLLKRELHPMVLECYASSLRLGERWSREFREFWALPDDFTTLES